jgi:hypothetical protein
MIYKEIDYTKLNERIVEQASEITTRYSMTEEQTRKLIEDKFERARQYKEALDKSPLTY